MNHSFETCERKYSVFNFTVSGTRSHTFVNNKEINEGCSPERGFDKKATRKVTLLKYTIEK